MSDHELPSAMEVAMRRAEEIANEPDPEPSPRRAWPPLDEQYAAVRRAVGEVDEETVAVVCEYLEQFVIEGDQWMLKVARTPLGVSKLVTDLQRVGGLSCVHLIQTEQGKAITLLGFVNGLLEYLGCQGRVVADAETEDGRPVVLHGFRPREEGP